MHLIVMQMRFFKMHLSCTEVQPGNGLSQGLIQIRLPNDHDPWIKTDTCVH